MPTDILFFSSSTELLTKILVFAAESAADAALALPASRQDDDLGPLAPRPSAVDAVGGGGGGSAGWPSSETGWVSRRPGAAAGAGAGAAAATGSMSDFRRRATGALRAARSMADQRGMDPHDVETIIFRLAKGWICQQKLGGGGGGDGGVDAGAGVFVGAGLRGGGGGGGGGDSVFVRDAREVGYCRLAGCYFVLFGWVGRDGGTAG